MLITMILNVMFSLLISNTNVSNSEVITNEVLADTASVYILNDSASNNHYTLDFNCDYKDVNYVNVWLTIKRYIPANLSKSGKDEELIEEIQWDTNYANADKEANCDDTPYFYESEEASEVINVEFSTNKDSLDIGRKNFQKSWWIYLSIITKFLE